MSFLGTSSMPYTSLLLIPTPPPGDDYESILALLASDITQCQSVLAALHARECHASMLVTLYALAFWAAYLAVWYFSFVASGLRGMERALPVVVGPILSGTSARATQRDRRKVDCFTITMHEFNKTIPMLWGHLKEFIKLHLEHIAGFMSVDGGNTYNRCLCASFFASPLLSASRITYFPRPVQTHIR
ncbi:hypothetical protein B0H17DRAFT_1151960 [Mycena rosella]|uniref:Uncharacterized protein n=1 Tax=Mycena rosella TaxID=1033263 RepID=A0AAD7FIG9_MYCRO|nr:hypothetical protein B0H17DRAFT_1151960 [Mycena rosella]